MEMKYYLLAVLDDAAQERLTELSAELRNLKVMVGLLTNAS